MIEKARQIVEAGITFSMTMEAKGKLKSITFCKGYVEPGYDNPESGIIAIGDFSAVTESPISTASDSTQRRQLQPANHSHWQEQIVLVVQQRYESVLEIELPSRIVDGVNLDGSNAD